MFTEVARLVPPDAEVPWTRRPSEAGAAKWVAAAATVAAACRAQGARRPHHSDAWVSMGFGALGFHGRGFGLWGFGLQVLGFRVRASGSLLQGFWLRFSVLSGSGCAFACFAPDPERP